MANRQSRTKGMLCIRHAFAWKNLAKLKANENGFKIVEYDEKPDSLTLQGQQRASGEGRFLRTLSNCPRIWYCSPSARTTETLVRALVAAFAPRRPRMEECVEVICAAALRGPDALAKALLRYKLDFEIRFDMRLLDRYDGVRTDLTSKGFKHYFPEEVIRRKSMGTDAGLHYAPPGGSVACKRLEGKYYRPGESNFQAIMRVMSFRTDVEADCADEWVGICTHNSIIRAFVYLNEGFHPTQFREIDKLSIPNGSYWSWKTSKEGILVPDLRGFLPPMSAENDSAGESRELEAVGQ